MSPTLTEQEHERVEEIRGLYESEATPNFLMSDYQAKRYVDLIAIIDRLTTQPQWLPIESAPKDGSAVVLVSMVGPSRRMFVNHWIAEDGEIAGWDDWVEDATYQPTHWKPFDESLPNHGAMK